ncbi:survival motor neuron protein-like isoform X2 [Argonauta hians]
MSETNGFLVFQRGQDTDDSDVWDDTALIKAYDNAVDKLKAQLDDKMESEPTPPSHTEKSSRKNKKHSKKKNKCKWKVGDNCVAVYTEDSLLYEAKIISIDPDHETCYVRYTGYGNEEQQLLSDLILPESNSYSPQPKADAYNFGNSESTLQSQKNQKRKSGKNRSPRGKTPDKHPSSSWMPPFLGMHSDMSNFPGMTMPPFPGMPSPNRHMNFPSIPPPPPPPMASWDMDNNEALCSMLMSWYMSGYHTGYYQGLKSKHK